MKKHHIILSAAAAAMAALPLAGCHNGKQPELPAIEQTTPKDDTPQADTIDYERMRRLQVLLRGGGKWESEK